MKRVVITGIGAVSPFGQGVQKLCDSVAAGETGVKVLTELAEAKGLMTHLGAKVPVVDAKAIPRDHRRSMGPMSIFATLAAKEALEDAGGKESFEEGRLGCIIGSTIGSTNSLDELYASFFESMDLSRLVPTKFFHCISNTAAMNVATSLALKGCVQAPAGACASAILAMGGAFDQIRLGRQDAVLCGGCEELSRVAVAMFDLLFATSTHYNDKPELSPRPFDAGRDGLVCGEGAGVLLLEEYEHARARKAKIYAEVLGFANNANGTHISQLNPDALELTIRNALREADVPPEEIDYVNAHATGTKLGDAAEAESLRRVFGDRVPVSSLKGYLGHTLAASGALELELALNAMQTGVLPPTRNLSAIDPACAGVHHLTKLERKPVKTVLKNSFGFGGVNTALVLRSV